MHPQVVELLRGDTVAGMQLIDGHVVIDLAPVVTQIQARLCTAGFTDVLPVGSEDFNLTIFESTELASIQSTLDLLVTLRWLMPLLALLSVAGFAWLSPGPARALAIGMVVVLVALALVRSWYAGDRTLTLDDAAATAVFDVVTGYLRTPARGVALGGLLVAGAAWVLMPGNAWRVAIDGFVTRHRQVLYGLIIALGTILVVLQHHPSILQPNSDCGHLPLCPRSRVAAWPC